MTSTNMLMQSKCFRDTLKGKLDRYLLKNKKNKTTFLKVFNHIYEFIYFLFFCFFSRKFSYFHDQLLFQE